jgi:hypothetical protein
LVAELAEPEQEQELPEEPMAFTQEESDAAQELVEEVVLSLAPQGPENFSGDIKL